MPLSETTVHWGRERNVLIGSQPMEQCSGQPAQSFWIFKNPRVLATTWHGVHHAIDQKWNPTKALKQQGIGTVTSFNNNQNTKFKFLEIKTCKVHEQQGIGNFIHIQSTSKQIQTSNTQQHSIWQSSHSKQSTAYNTVIWIFRTMFMGFQNCSRV